MREPWWPDWRGETVVIAASGLSQRVEDIQFARGRSKVMAINNTWQPAPWADVLYACDGAWWKCEDLGYGQHALREFGGLLVSGHSNVPGTRHIAVNTVNDELYPGSTFGGGGNSAFQAINIAVLWGADRILLTGVDCMNPGEHWHGPHTNIKPLVNSRQSTMDNWKKAFSTVAPLLAARGVEVINCTRQTALECFPRAKMEGVL